MTVSVLAHAPVGPCASVQGGQPGSVVRHPARGSFPGQSLRVCDVDIQVAVLVVVKSWSKRHVNVNTQQNVAYREAGAPRTHSEGAAGQSPLPPPFFPQNLQPATATTADKKISVPWTISPTSEALLPAPIELINRPGNPNL